MKYKYIIFLQNNSGDVGNCELVIDKKIKCLADIRKTEKMIEDRSNVKVIITNYKYVGMVWK